MTTWLYQINPEGPHGRFNPQRLATAVRRGHCLRFHFSQHSKDVRRHDRVLIYLNRNGAGLYGIGEVVTTPRGNSKKVRIRLRPQWTHRLLAKPLPPEFFRRFELTLFSTPRKVVHLVSEEQWQDLQGLLQVFYPTLSPPKRRIRPRECHTCEVLNKCWNCTRFYNRVLVPRREKFLDLLRSGSKLRMIRAVEVYIPGNAPGGQSDDFGKVLRRFKKGDQRFEYRLAISLFHSLEHRGPAAFRNAEVVVPIPCHHSRVRRRGYNPAAVLGRFVAQYYGIPFCPVLTQRKRISRRKLRGAMGDGKFIDSYQDGLRVRSRQAIAGKRILLIDDVLTDGATLEAVTRKLLQVGGKGTAVYGLAVGLTKKKRKGGLNWNSPS